jgi:hypothetical protein
MISVLRSSSLLIVLLGISGFAQYAPISTIGNVSTYSATTSVQITAKNFTNIGNCDLKILYDPVVAMATSVVTGPGMGGVPVYSIAVPGEITISWYRIPAGTLPENSVIFTLGFTKAANGLTAITWFDDGNSCQWADGNYNGLIDVPTSNYYINGSLKFLSNEAPHTILPVLNACNGSFIDIPVKVTSFSDIGKVNLQILYDQTLMAYISWNNVSGFPGMIVNSPGAGIINISGIVSSGGMGFSLADSSVLISLQFYLQAGSSNLTFIDNGVSCQYSGAPPVYYVLNDLPFSNHYFNGLITGREWPAAAGSIFGPQDGKVCKGQSGVVFSVEPISNTLYYNWSFPPGFTIMSGMGTNTVGVNVENNSANGDVIVYGVNECGNGNASPVFPLTTNSPPFILTQPSTPATVIAGVGSAHFRVTAGGSDSVFQWQEFRTDWQDVADGGVYGGANTAELIISRPPLFMNSYRYRCRIEGICLPEVYTDGLATLFVSPAIGIEDDRSDFVQLSINPNPITASSRITIKTPVGARFTITLFNMLGEELYTDSKENYLDGKYIVSLPACIPRMGVAFVCLAAEHNGKIFTRLEKLISVK